MRDLSNIKLITTINWLIFKIRMSTLKTWITKGKPGIVWEICPTAFWIWTWGIVSRSNNNNSEKISTLKRFFYLFIFSNCKSVNQWMVIFLSVKDVKIAFIINLRQRIFFSKFFVKCTFLLVKKYIKNHNFTLKICNWHIFWLKFWQWTVFKNPVKKLILVLVLFLKIWYPLGINYESIVYLLLRLD